MIVAAEPEPINGLQINHETHDLNKNGRGTIKGHLELHSDDEGVCFKTLRPITGDYIDRAEGRLVAEYTSSGGVEVDDCPAQPLGGCPEGYVCQGFPENAGWEMDLNGTYYVYD